MKESAVNIEYYVDNKYKHKIKRTRQTKRNKIYFLLLLKGHITHTYIVIKYSGSID